MQNRPLIDINTREGKTVVLEQDGDITFCVVTNDGCDQNNYLLIGLKMVVSSQLPRMPKEYIIRLVFDKYETCCCYSKIDVTIILSS